MGTARDRKIWVKRGRLGLDSLFAFCLYAGCATLESLLRFFAMVPACLLGTYAVTLLQTRKALGLSQYRSDFEWVCFEHSLYPSLPQESYR